RAKKERKGGLTVAGLGERAPEIVEDRRDPLTVSRRFRKRPHRALEILLLERPPSARIVVVGEDEIRSEIAGRSLEAPRPELGPLPDRANHLACWPFGLRPDRFEDEPPGDEAEARSSRVRPCGEEDRTPRLLDEKRLLLSVRSAKRWRSSRSASARKDLVEEPVLDRSILVADEDVRPKPLDGLQVEERKGRVVGGRKDDRVPFERSEE